VNAVAEERRMALSPSTAKTVWMSEPASPPVAAATPPAAPWVVERVST
jgi:hypothetical protein